MRDSDDPLMPDKQRFPMVSGTAPPSDEAPSRDRPFVLRGAPTVVPTQAKHRSPAHKTTVPQTTSLDNKTQDDSYTVPDD
ncbi:hypothetical protein HNR23_004247 [Nocardiopsis mwathae]|uniref:Uncharacterized protein n=1 Tax=Nocardiopsis mwathae TaxID=1472723 RepID=A0A7W9YLB5_9ACTN|nr:hypothetical protein [Nocardiopsis mwathae]MBB6174187.1 hypothetical protein [Nocardiopsis mwathae]